MLDIKDYVRESKLESNIPTADKAFIITYSDTNDMEENYFAIDESQVRAKKYFAKFDRMKNCRIFSFSFVTYS